MGQSFMEKIALLSPEEKAAVLADLDPDVLLWDWHSWARPEQQSPEGDWNIWIYRKRWIWFIFYIWIPSQNI
jgi:hypothetical protein